MDAVVHRVVDVVEHLHAPRKTLGTRTRDTHLSESVEPEVPQLKPISLFALQESVKFRMHLSEEVAVLDRERVSLESINADRYDLVLVQDDAAMLLPTRNLKALRVGEVDQLAMLGGVQDHYKNFLLKPDTLFRGCLMGSSIKILQDLKRNFYQMNRMIV